MIIFDNSFGRNLDDDYDIEHKVRNDIDVVREDVQVVSVAQKKKGIVSRTLSSYQLMNDMRKLDTDVCLVQYPLELAKSTQFVFYEAVFKYKSIVLIHSIESLQSDSENMDVQKREVELLNRFDVVMSQSHRMSEWLVSMGVTTPIVTFELFDYVCEKDISNPSKYDVSYVSHVGDVRPTFLYDTLNENEDCTFQILGRDLNVSRLAYNNFVFDCVEYSNIINGLEGKYGLVWSGDYMDTTINDYENENLVTISYVLSLYLAAEIPVIVWSGSVEADVVNKYHIGICVDDLYDLKKKINMVDEEEYMEMKGDVASLGQRIRSGLFSWSGIERALDIVYEE